MKPTLSSVIVLLILSTGSPCYPQDLKERQWVPSSSSTQAGIESIIPFEKERVTRNKIRSVEEWEYSYSFGEPNKDGKKLWSRTYDPHGNLTSFWDQYTDYSFTVEATGRRTDLALTSRDSTPAYRSKTTFVHDKNGNVVETSKTNCMVGNVPCKDIDEYDNNNRLIKHIHMIGNEISDKYVMSYDPSGRRLEKVVFAKDGSTSSTAYKYDAKGSPLNDEDYRYEYTYLGRNVEKRSYSLQSQRLLHTSVSKFDARSNLIEKADLASVQYLSEVGPLKVVNPPTQTTRTYKYDEKDRVIEERIAQRYGTSAMVDLVAYSYDAQGLIEHETRTRVGQEAEADVTTFKYAENGNILEILSHDLRGRPKSVKRLVYTTY